MTDVHENERAELRSRSFAIYATTVGVLIVGGILLKHGGMIASLVAGGAGLHGALSYRVAIATRRRDTAGRALLRVLLLTPLAYALLGLLVPSPMTKLFGGLAFGGWLFGLGAAGLLARSRRGNEYPPR